MSRPGPDETLRAAGRLLAGGVDPAPLLAGLDDGQRAALGRAIFAPLLERAAGMLGDVRAGLNGRARYGGTSRVYEVWTGAGPGSDAQQSTLALLRALEPQDVGHIAAGTPLGVDADGRLRPSAGEFVGVAISPIGQPCGAGHCGCGGCP